MSFKTEVKKAMTRRNFLVASAAVGVGIALPIVGDKRQATAQLPPNLTVKDPRFSLPVIDPTKISKFVDPLPAPPILDITGGKTATLRIIETNVQILPSTLGLTTTVWCYRAGTDYTDTFLGPTIVASSNVPNEITYDYTALKGKISHLLKNGVGTTSVIDKNLHGTDMGEPEVRFIAHLHGAKGVKPDADGYAEAWVTPDGGTGNTPQGTRPPTSGGTQTHTYPNAQTASLAWYHDHALGITRLNVYAGGAGGYIITDTVEAGYILSGQLPGYGIPLVIQDRMFYPDGRLAYPDLDAIAAGLIAQKGCTPWAVTDISTRPEYFGDVMVVNGKAWPFLTVEPRVYRFRFLNGCNSRVLDLSFQPPNPTPAFQIIGTEGGFLPGSSDVRANLVMGGAERLDVLIDFRNFAGRTLTLINKGAKKPYPGGRPPNPQADGLIMQFRVSNTPVGAPLASPPNPWNTNIRATPGSIRRVLLYEGVDQFGRIKPLLGTITGAGTAASPFTAVPKIWDDPVTESPRSGSIEIWEIFNTTVDSHPIHIHEALFWVRDRQPIAFDKKLVGAICGAPSPNFPITIAGAPIAAIGYETGFKDTVVCPPGQVTRIAVDFTGTEPGRFVWHCHILEHEDHEMMRPYDILPPAPVAAPAQQPYNIYNTPGNIIQLK